MNSNKYEMLPQQEISDHSFQTNKAVTGKLKKQKSFEDEEVNGIADFNDIIIEELEISDSDTEIVCEGIDMILKIDNSSRITSELLSDDENKDGSDCIMILKDNVIQFTQREMVNDEVFSEEIDISDDDMTHPNFLSIQCIDLHSLVTFSSESCQKKATKPKSTRKSSDDTFTDVEIISDDNDEDNDLKTSIVKGVFLREDITADPKSIKSIESNIFAYDHSDNFEKRCCNSKMKICPDSDDDVFYPDESRRKEKKNSVRSNVTMSNEDCSDCEGISFDFHVEEQEDKCNDFKNNDKYDSYSFLGNRVSSDSGIKKQNSSSIIRNVLFEQKPAGNEKLDISGEDKLNNVSTFYDDEPHRDNKNRMNLDIIYKYEEFSTDTEILSEEDKCHLHDLKKMRKKYSKVKSNVPSKFSINENITDEEDLDLEETEVDESECKSLFEDNCIDNPGSTKWTETDDSGSIRQVTQIKTETSITLSGEGTERIHDFKSENELPSINEQLSDAEEEMLSFVEKRNFFQRLSLTSEMLPLNSKWTQEVSLDDIPMAQGEIVKEQISFEDKLKMFEPDEDKRKKAQKRDKHEQPTVYRYDFTKPNKDRKSAAELAVSELDKAEQIVKQVNNVLNEEECCLMIRNQDSKVENLLANRFESAFTLENIEHEVSSLLAEVDKEEKELSQKDIIVERGLKAKKPSSLECKTGTSYSDYVDYNEGLDASCEIASYLDSTVKTPETLLSLSTQSEEMTCEDLRLSGIAHETESHHLKHCSGGEMESTTKNLEEIKSCSVSIPLEYVTPEQLSSVQELQERKSPLSHTMNMCSSSKESEHSITLFEQETPFSESQFKNVGQRDESGCEIDKYTKNKKFCDLGTLTFPPQHFDISEKFNSHIKTQILHEELDQSLEESPLEVKHIAEDIEHLLASSPCQTKDVMKQIRTEIFSQELGEDIESGSPEKKNIILDALEKEAGEPRSEVIEVEDKSYVSNNDSETHIIASQGEIISQRLQAVEDIAITDSSMSRSFAIDTFSHQDVNIEFCESEISHQDFVPVKISQCPFDNDVLSSGNNLVERDDYLKEYEEAKEEHSLSEQLLALASDVRRTSKCLDDDEIFSESCSSHMGFEHNLGSIHSQSETEKHRRLDTDVKYSRADKKEMRLLKSTKQVSTIEEHSSVESNDSSQELVQAEVFSPDIVPEVMILKETSEVCDVMLDSKEEFQVEKYGKGEDMCDQTVNESICFSNAVKDLPIVGNSILSREHVDINADKNSQETEFHKDPKEYFSSKDMFKDYKKNDSDAESVKSDDKKWDSDAEVVKIDDKRSDSDAECVRTDGELTPTQRKEESFSSSGETESPYYSVETSGYERTPHSTPAASRPCSSEFEVNILSGQGSEYETCATSQDVSGEVSGSYATAATSQETSYSTACSSLSHSSRESAYSVDSESSGHLGSIEVSSEASETLVPSAQEMELEFGQDIDVTVLDEDSVLIENAIKEPYDTYIPESVIRSGIELPFMKNWDMHKSSIEHHARQLSNHWNLHDAREEESLNCLSERREECKSNSSDALTVLDKKYKCELDHQIDYQGMNLTTNSSSDDHQGMHLTTNSSSDDHQGMHLTTNSSSDDHQGESDSLQFKKRDILKETEGKEENVLFDIGNIHDHSENIDDDQCYSATIETNQEKNVSDHIDEDPPSMSESSATHSEQTWQTSSADTAFHIPSSIPSSYFPLGGQNSVTLDSLPDKSNVKCTSEHSLPLSPKSKFINPASSYLQLNGPVEVDFNPEYDTFDDESAPQGHETVASYQMNDKNIDQSDFENASQTPADDTIGIKGSFACAQVYSEEQSKVDDDSFCSVISVEAEKPEAQQEQVLNYQDYEECFQPECVALSDDTTYLPESEQCSLRNILLGSSDLSQPEDVPREFSDEISSGLESHEALGFFKGATAPNVGTVLQSGIQNVDSIEKSDILDTSPEDDRYDYKSHESKSQNVYEVHEAQKYEVILVSDEETAIELVGQSINQLQIGYQDHSVQESEITADKDLYLHQEGAMNMFQFGDSVQIPNSVPSGDEDKQSTPSFDTPAHRFFSKTGDHEGSSTSSLQEFENLETEMGAGRSSRTSSDSYDRAPVTRSGEHDDISMCSLNEFEKLEQDCVEAEQVDQIESEIVGMLSEIEEGHESQASDGQETISDDGHDQGSDNSDDYEKRMIEIDEIIRMAQNNVEKFHDEVLDDLSEGATLEFTVTQGIQASGGNSTEHSIVNHSACQKNFSEADSLTSVTNESFSMLKDETDTNSSSKHGAGKFTLPVSNVEEFTEQLFGVSHNVTEFLATESSKSLETDKSCILENQELLSGLRTDEQHIEEEAMEILAFDSIKSGNDTNSILWAEKIRLYQGVEDSEILPDFLETDNGTGGGQDSSSSGEKNSCSGKGDCMVSSTDSIDPSSSTATHATYQFETDSVMSSSINSAQASGEECTMVSSTDTLEPEPKLSYSQGELIDEETTSSDGMISNVNCLKMSCFESESPSNISSATQIEKLECRDQSENSKYDVHEKVAGFLEKNDEMFENPEHISYDEGHSGFSNLESESDILHVCEMYKFEDNRDAIICEEVLSKQSQKLITSLIPEKTDSLEEVKDCLEKLADELQENVKDSIPERLTENPSLIENNILSNNDQPFPLDSYPHPISSASKSLHYPAPCDLSSLSSEMIQPQAPAFGFFQPDESVGDEDVVSKTTTTTRIVTTVTTEDGDELKEQVTEEGDDELRHSMEVILDQFMHEDVSDTQSFQPQ